MKKISRALLVLIALIVVALVAVACPDNNTDDPDNGPSVQLSIAADEMPLSTTFVQGEDLDLFGGILTVVKDGVEKKIPLDSPDITVSGYDKSVLGPQEVVISYDGGTTKLIITTIKRLAITNAELNYFVGEAFDNSKGDIVLTKNDGSTQQGILSQATITGAENFSATAGVKNITVNFGGFSDTLTVNVYAIADAKFSSPTKRTYESHDTVMDLTGAVITLKDAKANANQGGVTKNINVTAGMVSGFNPSAATIDNRVNALSQSLSVTYAGKSFPFSINVTFSDVSVIGYNAQSLTDIDWNDDNLVLTDEQAAKSVEAAELYFGLEEDEKALINADELANIMRATAAYTYNDWYASMLEINDVLELSYNSGAGVADMNFIATSYEEAKANYEILVGDDTTDKIAQMGANNILLWKILADENLSSIVMYGDATTGEYTIRQHCMFAVPQERVAEVISELQFAIDLYELAGELRHEDVVDGVSDEVAAVLQETYTFIRESFFFAKKNVFTKVNAWTDNNLFDALYQYYWDRTRENSNDNEAWTNMVYLTFCYLPGALEDYYNYAIFTYEEINNVNAQIEQYNGTVDSSSYLYYYFKMLGAIDEIMNGDNELYKGLFQECGILYPFYEVEPIPSYMVTDDLDYFYRTFINEMYGVEEFENLLADYFVIVESYINGDYFESDTQYSELFMTEVPEFINKFMNYSPTIQAYFLYSIHTCGIVDLLDISADSYTYLSLLVSACYTDTDVLAANTVSVFRNLLYAYENYVMRIYYSETDLPLVMDNFRTLFTDARNAYNSLSNTEKEKISFLYDKVNTINGLYNNNMELNNVSTGNTTWDNKIKSFATDVLGPVYMCFALNNDANSNYEAYGAYITLVEWAQAELDAFIAEIEAVEDATLKANIYKAFYYGEYEVLRGSGKVGIESVFYGLRAYYTALSMNLTVIYESYPLYSLYTDSLKQHMIDSADIMAAVVEALYNNTIPNLNNVSGIEDYFMSYISLDGDEWTMQDKVVFADIHYYYDLFHSAFVTYYTQKLGGSSFNNAVSTFMDLVYGYTYYKFANENFASGHSAISYYRDVYRSALNAFTEAYNAMTAVNRTAFETMFGKALVDAYQARI